MPNPATALAVDDAAAAAVLPREIPNRGVTLGFLCEKRLRQLRCYKHHMHKIQRNFQAAQATLARLNQVWRLCELEQEEDEDVEEPSKFVKHDEARKTIEDIDNYLDAKQGAAKVPLSCIV